ncbi:MAG: hypothetical protein RR060_00645 [Victivallaceae bacterium]
MKSAIFCGAALLSALFLTEAIPAGEVTKSPIKSEVVKDAVKISLRIEEELKLANCYITVSNESNGNVIISGSNPMVNFTWTIIDTKSKKSVEMTEMGRRMLENLATFRRISETLPPGKSYTYRTKLTELFVLKPETDYSLSVKGFFYKDYGPIHYQFTDIPVKFTAPGANAKFENEDIVLTAQLNKLSFMPNEQLGIQISLQNKSNSPLGMVSAPNGATFKVEVVRKTFSSAAGAAANVVKVAPQAALVKKQPASSLQPGEKLTLNDVGLNSVMPLNEPGEYGLKITGTYLKDEANATPKTIKLNELNFTIKNPAAASGR